MKISQIINISLRLIGVSLLIFSIIYPLLTGGIGQIWQQAARGSLVEIEGEAAGSRVIGQQFDSPYFFHGRPSSIAYDASRSGSANLGPVNPELRERVSESLQEIAQWNKIEGKIIPADLVTESGSALDPHISLDSALLQIPRVAEAAGASEEEIREIVMEKIEPLLLGLYGQKRVNVLELNIAIRKEVLE